MKRKSNLVLGALLLMIGATVGFIAFHGKSNDAKSESVGETKSAETSSKANKPNGDDEGDKDEEGIESMARAMVRNGQTYVMLTEEIIERDGIRVTTLTDTSEAVTVTAFGKVIMPQDLAEDASVYSSAYSAYKAAVSKKGASQKEYERLKTLNATKNVSDKVCQAALAEYDADESDVNSTSQALLAAKTKLQQEWGPTVSSWLVDPAGNKSSRLLDTKDLLVEASLPSGSEPLHDIQYGVIQLTAGKNVEARYLSAAPSVNPDIQGPVYFFLLPATSSSLLPGMNVTVHICAGKNVNGVLVPSSAVVWMNGGTWVYIETRENEFTRRPTLTDKPVVGGFFVTGGLKAEDRIVTTGAQLLLSQEFSSEIRAAD